MSGAEKTEYSELRNPDEIACAIDLMTKKRTIPTVLGTLPLMGFQTLLSGVFGYATAKCVASPEVPLVLLALTTAAVGLDFHRRAREAVSRDISYRWVNSVYSKARYTKGVKMKINTKLWGLRDHSKILKNFSLPQNSFKMQLNGEYPGFAKVRHALVKTGLALALGGLIVGSAHLGKVMGERDLAQESASVHDTATLER